MYQMSQIVLIFLILIITLGQVCQGKPSYSDGWSSYHNRVDVHRRAVNECETSIDHRKLCQQCAKITKALPAYTMCCERRENTREWCIKFLNFGLTASSSSSTTYA